MTDRQHRRVALLWRGDPASRATASTKEGRLAPVFAALAREGVAAEPSVYCEEVSAEVRQQLLGMDAVMVWVDPLSDGRDRRDLDPMLRDVAARGVWVSAHPDVILKMGVKEVLHRTRDLGWGTDTDLYATPEDFRARFPDRLAAGPRVLKQNRGNGGQGVWKVELPHGVAPTAEAVVEVLHARRGSQIEHCSLAALMERCAAYFAGEGRLIDQPFQARLPEGMIRCYLVQDRVVGFGRQLIKALLPPEAGEPGPRIMSGADYPPFQALRSKMEADWVPAMTRRLQIDASDLPVIWDADFLYGPKSASGEDTYVLCEINVSGVLPIPEQAPAEIARCVASRIGRA
ncbi:MAG TPA: Cj0069 family protein [Caulobacteraceae bacterium]|nr:Cj0069 family protein [Caulobacteraceae bacterium]